MRLSRIERNYAFHQLAKRVGINGSSSTKDPSDYFPVQIVYHPHAFSLEIAPAEKALFFHQAQREEMDILVHSRANSIKWVETSELLPPGINLNISQKIPILFPDEGSGKDAEFIQTKENTVIFRFDILTAVFFMLSRYEEVNSHVMDKFGRFPAAESAACKQRFIEQPIVDEYALILRAWISYLLPEWQPEVNKPAIMLTHDIDFIRTLPNLRKIIRVLIKKSKKDGFGQALYYIKSILKSEKKNLPSSAYMQAIGKIIILSKENNLKSTFFFKASHSGFYDSGYQINHPDLKPIFAQIMNAGFKIGLHPGFYTYRNSKRILQEKIKLEKATGTEIAHCRQHYLRFAPGETWQHQQAAGFQFDHSMAYAEQIGFRCGTCHSFHPFDIHSQKEMEIIEIPLIIMDSTLKDYMRLSTDTAKEKVLNLAERCLSVEGIFTLLWHNTSFSNDWENWGEMYASVLPFFEKMQ